MADTPSNNPSDYIPVLNNDQINQLTPDQLIQRYQQFNNAPSEAIQAGQQNFNAQDRINNFLYTSFRSELGRDPTADEWSKLYPNFQGPDWQSNGRAALATYKQQLANDPSNPLSPVNPQNPNYQKTLAPYNDSVTQQFQATLGRAPTADELSHFSGLLATGQTDAYGLGSFLKTMPEYMNSQDAQFRQGLNSELQNYDTTEFNREKGGIMADYAARGMQPGNSPSLDYALTDLMGKIASNRSAYLASLSAAQYGGNKDVAVGNYQNSLNQMYQQNQQNRQNNLDMSNYQLNRGNSGADYYTQMNDYMNFLNKNRSRGTNPLYGAAGGIIGAGIGAGLGGGPAGAGVGYQVGSGLGNAFAYQNY